MPDLDLDDIRAEELLEDDYGLATPMPASGSQNDPINAGMFDDSPVKPPPPKLHSNKKTKFEG